MEGKKRHTGGVAKALIHRRRMLVGQLWLRGYSVREIADMVRMEAARPNSLIKGCELTTHVTVHYDVVECRKQWLERDGRKLDERRSEQVSRLLDISHQAWIDFRNKADNMRPQYLRIALDAEEKLAKIMGTLAPVKLAGRTDDEPLVPPTVIFQWPDGTEFKPPRNGHEPIEALAGDNGDQ